MKLRTSETSCITILGAQSAGTPKAAWGRGISVWAMMPAHRVAESAAATPSRPARMPRYQVLRQHGALRLPQGSVRPFRCCSCRVYQGPRRAASRQVFPRGPMRKPSGPDTVTQSGRGRRVGQAGRCNQRSRNGSTLLGGRPILPFRKSDSILESRAWAIRTGQPVPV